jgi:hypothetical protein
MKGNVMFALITPRGHILGLFNSRWKAEQGKALWNYEALGIKRVWVERKTATIFEVTEHKYKRIET